MNYYEKELSRIVTTTEYAPKIKVTNPQGEDTKYMDLNPESAKALIEWLQTNFIPHKIEFTKINSDMYGNPRYVCHYLEFADTYEKALKLAKTLGGRKYNNKSYGGGIVFQSYNIDSLAKSIVELKQA